MHRRIASKIGEGQPHGREADDFLASLIIIKTILKKIGNWVGICVGFLFGIAIFCFIVGGLTIFLVRELVPSFPGEFFAPIAHNIADWRSLVVIAIGCLAFLCFFVIRSLVSRPLEKLIEKSFVKWDAVVARGGRISKWIEQFVLSKPSAEEIQAAQNWTAQNKEFDKRVFTGDYRWHSHEFESTQHSITKQKKALPSYPRLKKAGKIRGYFIGIPICFFLAACVLFGRSGEDADDQETTDSQEVVDYSAYGHWFENPVLRHWWLNITVVCSAVGFSLWVISSRSEKRFLKILGADARYEEGDDEIYVADPTSFESWRQAFIDRHGHDMSVEQEKKLRAKVDKVIDAYEQERAAIRKLNEKIDEGQ